MLRGVKRRALSYSGLLLLFIAVMSVAIPVFADNVVQSFNSSGKLVDGNIVSLKSSSPPTVEANPANRADLIFGVVVDKNLAPITLNSQGAATYVSSQGEYSVLVTTEKGVINKNDPVSVSSAAGIGAKADPNQPIVLGKAVTGYNGQDQGIGKAGKYNIGKITVDINITRNPGFKNTLAIPAPLQKIGNSIAGRETSPLKIYIALVIFLVSSVLTTLLLVFGTKGGLIAIGRNPLSKHTILRALFQVIVLAVLIFLASLIGVYLLLRL